MPVYAAPDSTRNGFIPAGSAVPEPIGSQPQLPAGVNAAPAEDEPSLWGAAFRQNNLMAGFFRPTATFEPASGYNPYTDKAEISGYEQWGAQFADSRSPEQTAWIKQQIDSENEDRQLIAESGATGILTSIAAGVIDPVTVASLFIPGAQGGLFARVASQAAIGGAATAASEIGLNNQQYTRTLGESAAHVTAGALFSGVFASAGALASRSLRDSVTEEVAGSLNNMSVTSAVNRAEDTIPSGGSAGAMRIADASLDDLTLAGGRGYATPVAAETRTRGWRREEAAVVVSNKQTFSQYKADGGDLNFAGFREEVAGSLNNMSVTSAVNRAEDTIPSGGSAGAMRIADASLDDLTLAGGRVADAALKAGGYMTPATRLITSPSRNARLASLELAENNFTIRGNERGYATPVAAETRTRGWRREEAAVVVSNKQAFSQYKADGGDLNFAGFREEVGNAMRNGDVHANSFVQDTAVALRQVVDRVKKEQQELGLLAPDEELKALGQKSYFPRVYKVGKIVAERDKFRQILTTWWSRGASPMSEEEADIAADIVINKIVGAKIPQEFANVFSVKAAGSTKERTLSMPDSLMRDYLESDANYVLQRHIREAAPEIELTRSFGSRTMKDQLKDIQDEYDDLLRNVPVKIESERSKRLKDLKSRMTQDNFDAYLAKNKTSMDEEFSNKAKKEQSRLSKSRESDIRDITAMRDRLTGTYGMPDDPASFFVRAGRGMRFVNFMTKLGGMTLSAIPDLARGVMAQGMQRSMKGYSALISNSPALKASKEEMRKMAVALETVLNTRSRLMADLTDSSTRTNAVEAGLERATDVFGKLTLMSQFNDINKAVNGMVTSDGILSGAIAKTRLAKLGINDNMASRIQAEFQKHGEVIDGWRIGNFDKWDDQYVSGVFQSAVLKDANNIIITPGVGDTPLWSSSPIGRTIFQFRSFTTASYNRATLGGLQEGSAQFYYGAAFQVGLGALTYALKQAAAGREVDWSPEKLTLEGIDRSGILGPLMEYNNMAEKATGGMAGLGAVFGTSTQSRYASRGFIGSAIGPTFGLLDNVTSVTSGMLNGDAGEKVLHNVRTLIPGQNLFWIAPLLNQVDPGAK